MVMQIDDSVGGKSAYNKFVAGAVIGIGIFAVAIAISGHQMDIGKTKPIAAPPPNAGASK